MNSGTRQRDKQSETSTASCGGFFLFFLTGSGANRPGGAGDEGRVRLRGSSRLQWDPVSKKGTRKSKWDPVSKRGPAKANGTRFPKGDPQISKWDPQLITVIYWA